MSAPENEMGDADGQIGAPLEHTSRMEGLASVHEEHGAAADEGKKPSFELLRPHLEAGHDLIPLHRWDSCDGDGRPKGKAPRDAGWPELDYAGTDWQAHMESGGNVGVRLRDTDLVIDVDPRNFDDTWGRTDPFTELVLLLGLDPDAWPCVCTGGGGMHYYLSKASGTAILHALPDFPGVEFKTAGTQVVAAGSLHPETCRLYRADEIQDDLSRPPEAPQSLLDALRRPDRSGSGTTPGEIEPEMLEKLLGGLDVEAYRPEKKWRDLMMACHHATAGYGVDEFVRWSISDPQYVDDEHLIRTRWDSLDAERCGGITIATLYKAVIDAERRDLVEAARQSTAPADFEGEEVDGLPTQDDDDDGRATERKRVADEWVWVADAMVFVRRGDNKKYTPAQWKSMYAHLKQDGDVLNAVWKGRFKMRRLESLVFLPGRPEFPDGDGNGRYNIWRPSGVEARPGDISTFTEHMAYLFPNEVDRGHVLDYLALLSRRQPCKVHFALLIRGEQGTGKSWLGRLMGRIIGDRNVVRPSNEEVTSKWTAWMEGAELAVIEELMSLGRLEVANRLKPVITDPTLRIEDKLCKLYSIPNHLNLLCFTNHRDALRIEHGDRRWLVVFSPAEARDEAYYGRLFDFLEGDGPAAVKYWLDQREVRLNPKGVAPQTRAKEEMRRLSMGDVETHLLALLEDGLPPFDFDLVRLEDVVGALSAETTTRGQRSVRNRASRFLQDEAHAVPHNRYTKGGDRRPWQLWSIRDHDRWREAGAARRIDAYLERKKEQFEG